jgi:hypothetical protein
MGFFMPRNGYLKGTNMANSYLIENERGAAELRTYRKLTRIKKLAVISRNKNSGR